MILNNATPILMDILQSFISVLKEIDPQWQDGYLRLACCGSSVEVKGSYSYTSGANIIDVLEHKEFFHSVPNKVKALLKAIEKEEALFLMVVDSNLKYDVKFEFNDMRKWQITKMDGRSGIPEGVD